MAPYSTSLEWGAGASYKWRLIELTNPPCTRLAPPVVVEDPVREWAVDEQEPERDEKHEGQELDPARNRPVRRRGGCCVPHRSAAGRRRFAASSPRDDGSCDDRKHELETARGVVKEQTRCGGGRWPPAAESLTMNTCKARSQLPPRTERSQGRFLQSDYMQHGLVWGKSTAGNSPDSPSRKCYLPPLRSTCAGQRPC